MRGSNETEQAHKEHINRYKMAHCIGVAEYMRERAEDYGYNPDVMYIIGLLHDVGYINGRSCHEEYGAELLRVLGIDDEVAFAIEHHGEKASDVEEKFGTDSINGIYVLLLEADTSVDARGFRVGFDGRLADITERYGKGHNAVETVKANIEYIKNYQRANGIGKPTSLYHKKERREHYDRI